MFRWPVNSTLCLVLLSSLLLVGCGREAERTWTSFEGYEVRPLVSPIGEGTGFTEVSNSIAFSNAISTSAFVTNRHVVNGSGVATGDVDGDGLPDVFLAGMEHGSTLHRNRGNWQFEDVTLRANLGLVNPRATGAAFVDVDADGDQDLFVTSLGSGIQFFPERWRRSIHGLYCTGKPSAVWRRNLDCTGRYGSGWRSGSICRLLQGGYSQRYLAAQ